MGLALISRLGAQVRGPGLDRSEIQKPEWAPIKALIMAVIALSVPLAFFQVASNTTEFQRDFQSYYFAGHAYRDGDNPYSEAALTEAAGRNVDHPFVYPPLVLPFVSVFSLFNYSPAYFAFLLLKIGALIGLFAIWRRHFVDGPLLPFLVFAAVAFNAAIYIDLRVGNISIFEQLLVWIGLAYLLRNKVSAFLALILIASLFKLTLAAFLFIPIILDAFRNWKRVAAAFLIFAAIQFGSLALSPTLSSAFLEGLSGLTERGTINPSTLAAITDLIDAVGLDRGLREPISLVLYFAISIFVVVTSWKVARFHGSQNRVHSSALVILLFCVVYTLVSPRMKTYSLILMVVPAYIAINHLRNGRGIAGDMPNRRGFLLLGAFAMFSSVSLVTHGSTSTLGLVLSYSPLLAVFAAWTIYLIRIHNSSHIVSALSKPGEPSQ